MITFTQALRVIRRAAWISIWVLAITFLVGIAIFGIVAWFAGLDDGP